MKKKNYLGELIKIRNKSICVKVFSRKIHPKYKKPIKIYSKRWVHFESDSFSELNLGDKILFANSRPVSSSKHYVFIDRLV